MKLRFFEGDRGPFAPLEGGMVKIIVHMGLHRTATTTLQINLRQMRGSVENTSLVLREDMVRHGALDMRRWHRAGFWHHARSAEKRFFKAALKLGTDTVIVSEENLVGTMPGVVPGDFYSRFSVFVEKLVSLSRYADVYPRLVVRRQDDFLESVYAFRVARGLQQDFPTFFSGFNHEDLDWNRLAGSLAPFGSKAKIAVLEDWRAQGDVAQCALSFMGVEHTSLLGKGRGNRRLGYDSTRLILALNRAGVMPNLAERKAVLFPALAAAEKAGEEVSRCLDGLSLKPDQLKAVYAHLNDEPQTGFLPRMRAAFQGRLLDANRLFFERSEVVGAKHLWFD